MKSQQNIKHNIQEMEKGERDFGVLNTIKTLHKKVLNNDLVSEFDVFSVPVKLTFKGSEVYQTFCGGFMRLLLMAICVGLTVAIMFPSGFQLNSEISVIVVPSSESDMEQTFFDHTDEIISWRGILIGTENEYSDIANFSTFKAYIQNSQNKPVELEISTDCQTKGAEFCIKNSAINKNASFQGNFYDPDGFSKYLVIEKFWCDMMMDPLCTAMASDYYLEIKMTNFLKNKGGSIEPSYNRIISKWWNMHYKLNVTAEVFTSNSLFFGHLSNLLPFQKLTYLFSDYVQSIDIMDPTTQFISKFPDGVWDYAKITITPCGLTRQINENFDDVSDILLFFLSISETFYVVIFFLFIKHYNRNSGLLEIADSLFYIDDPKTKKKYDFKTGYQVFFACLLYSHPVYKLINFILTKMGTSLEEALPSKAICAIKLIKRSEEILQENTFYGHLNELSSMETQAARKIKLIEDQQEEKEDQKELEYFPFLPYDSLLMKKEKQLKKLAFEQFCKANEFISPERKNQAYKVITQRKLRHMLVHEMQRQFAEFVRNTRIQVANDVYQEVDQGENTEIMVVMHETSNNQMTENHFIRT